MKTIGLIGGMSWESSKMYYQFINTRINELAGGSHSAKSIMLSVDFAEIEKLSFAGDWDAIGESMKDAAQRLERAGADLILLCTNTIHIVSESIENAVQIPFIHIADATGTELQKKRLKKVGLLGTRFTMEKEFYTQLISEKYGVEVIIPNSDDRNTIHDIIYNELVKGKFTAESKVLGLEIIDRLKEVGVEGIIMGCTELPLLIPEEEIDIPSFDTAKIHAYAAAEWALQNP